MKENIDGIFCVLFGCILARVGYQLYHNNPSGFGLMVMLIGVVVMAIGIYLLRAKRN